MTQVQDHLEQLKALDRALRSVGATEPTLLELARQKNPGIELVPVVHDQQKAEQ